jgi:hypothetical protein
MPGKILTTNLEENLYLQPKYISGLSCHFMQRV